MPKKLLMNSPFIESHHFFHTSQNLNSEKSKDNRFTGNRAQAKPLQINLRLFEKLTSRLSQNRTLY